MAPGWTFEAREVPLNEEASGWDGSLDGEALNPAVFPWKAVVRHSADSTAQLNGEVALVR